VRTTRPASGHTFLPLAVLLSTGCAAAPPVTAVPAAAPPSAATAAAAGGVFPAPFTAAQIRDATRPGRTYVFRVESAGKPTVIRSIEFTRVDGDRAEMTAAVKDESGAVLRALPPKAVTFEELRSHGEFPRAAVTTAEETITVPAGRFECLVYRVQEQDGSVSRYFFAKDMPGAPVLFYTEKDGARLMTSTLLEHRTGQ
jgi:hypothetical protein